MNSSVGKWFSLIVIVTTGFVASLPFQGSPPDRQTNQPKTPATTLRISADENGAAFETSPRPVAGRVHGASLRQPSVKSTTVAPNRDAETELPPETGVPASTVPDWTGSKYTVDATGMGSMTSPPFEEGVDSWPARPTRPIGSDYPTPFVAEFPKVADNPHRETTDSEEVATGYPDSSIAEQPLSSSDSDNDVEKREYERQGVADTTNIYSSVHDRSASDDVEQELGRGEEPRFSDDSSSDDLPAPRPENRYAIDTFPSSESADEPQGDSSESDLPSPRPRLVVGEGTLPEPQGASGNRHDDDGFRSVPGRRVGSRTTKDQTIRSPVTRLVRLAPPSRKPPIRAPALHTVRDGDTLDLLAQRYWGDASRWRDIYSANRNVLTNPQLLPIGIRLKIPNDGFHRMLRK